MKKLLSLSLIQVLVFVSPVLNAKTSADQARTILRESSFRGGLIVHLGCGEGQLTTALYAGDSTLVQGLDADMHKVKRARHYVSTLKSPARVTFASFDGKRLPYIDNVVNLLVVTEPSSVTQHDMSRVVTPGDTVMIQDGDQWIKKTKPWPKDTDEWTHYLHGPNNNAVAQDRRVSYPFHVQWVGDPKWARHHNHLSSLSAMVSASGRIFAIVDEGPIESINQPSQWRLVARDAFNGLVLWKKSVGPWEGHLRPFRSGPTELSRRLVAYDKHVYVTLGYGKPVTCLDAATGRILQTYAQTEGAVEIIYRDGTLFLVTGEIDSGSYATSLEKFSASPPPRRRKVMAIEAESGLVKWVHSDPDTHELLPTTVCVEGDAVFYQNRDHVICLDGASGDERWRSPRPVKKQRLAWSTPTLVAYQDVLLSADCAGPGPEVNTQQVTWKVTAKPKRGNSSLGELIAFSTKDGSELWRCSTAQGYNSPTDVFVADGLVWYSAVPNITKADFQEGRDLHTGQVKRRLQTDAAFTTTHHHRCYRNKATDDFIFLGRTGTEMIDLQGDEPLRHNWIRGACQYGVLPCNGLLYMPPHSCACYIQSKLSGFWALAPARRASEDGGRKTEGRGQWTEDRRPEKGPAYGQIKNQKSKIINNTDWPTFRHDAARSGATPAKVGADLKPHWDTHIGGRLAQPVLAQGRLFISAVDRHTIHALDARSGKSLWQYTVGGRIDSPPTIYQGKVLFGSADGWVYCLRAEDGVLIWRFLAALQDRRTVAFDQVESVWPVTGSVLVHNGCLYATAGRSSYLDSGMLWYQLEPETGVIRNQRTFYDRDPQTGAQPEDRIDDVEMPGALPDVLACDGENIFWRDKRLDLSGNELKADVPHLYSSVGLLDDSWWHRTYWIYGSKVYGRASGWAVVANYVPSGRILSLDESSVFGFGRKRVGYGDRGLSDVSFQVFQASKQVKPIPGKTRLKNNNLALRRDFQPTLVQYNWSQDISVVARAMVLTEDILFLAGPRLNSPVSDSEPTFDGHGDAVLLAIDRSNGRQLSQHTIDARPVFDGLIAVSNNLYLSLRDGRVMCMSAN